MYLWLLILLPAILILCCYLKNKYPGQEPHSLSSDVVVPTGRSLFLQTWPHAGTCPKGTVMPPQSSRGEKKKKSLGCREEWPASKWTGWSGALSTEEREGSCASCRPYDGKAGSSEQHLERDMLPTLPLPLLCRIDKITKCINIPTSLLMTVVMPCFHHACFPAGHVSQPLEPEPREQESSTFYAT